MHESNSRLSFKPFNLLDLYTTLPTMKIPYHIPSLPKPQKQYNFQVDNSYLPFTHPCLPRLGSEPVHPASPFSPLDFVFVRPSSPIKPPPIESTPFRFIENVADLGYLASKLHQANEFAVDLEHNSYRSYQGLTCLMQISTRNEDFVVDTFKLREQIGPYLREFFQDPVKRKVMHGASNDILWLQRDFGIYVCNLFDTMQASKVIRLERNSLEFLLKYYCNVIANKEYQASDWRLRPLPRDMVKYAREDTHYLLYIQDLMLNKLNGDSLVNVFRRSYDVCIQMYRKDMFNSSTSYLHLYGLSEANLDAKQLGVVAALYEWRDRVAREEDESTGYILPNKLILEIAMQLPMNKKDLLKITGYDKEHLIKYADLLVDIIRHYVVDDIASGTFEGVAKLLNQKIDVSKIAQEILQEQRRIEGYNIKCQNCIWGYRFGQEIPIFDPVYVMN